MAECICGVDSINRCLIHPWVLEMTKELPAVKPEKPLPRRKRPGRPGIAEFPITPEFRSMVRAYHNSPANPTQEETAKKFRISTTTLFRILDRDENGQRIERPKVRPGRRTEFTSIPVTADMIAEMQRMYANKIPLKQIADIFSVSVPTVVRHTERKM